MEPAPRVAASTRSCIAATGSTRASARRIVVIVSAASAPTMVGPSAGAAAYRPTAAARDSRSTGTAETTRVRGRSAARPDARWAGIHRTRPVSVPSRVTASRMRKADVAANSVPARVGEKPLVTMTTSSTPNTALKPAPRTLALPRRASFSS